MDKRGLKKIIKNTIDCLKYPFLYPRNRFTGNHYDNWKILNWVRRMEEESRLFVHLSLHDSEISGSGVLEIPGGKILTLEVIGHEVRVVLGWPGGHWERVVLKLKSPKHILDVAWGEGGSIKAHVTDLPKKPRFISGQIIYNPFKWAAAKVVEWIHNWPLQIFHCLPEYTELGALDTGWKKAFGEDLCKDLRKALWKEGGLKAILHFRVTQIKEKWGYLHFYYTGGGEEVEKVISKYEDISSKTCIVCGKPATWISRGWISPYCDEHISDIDMATPIKEKEEGH